MQKLLGVKLVKAGETRRRPRDAPADGGTAGVYAPWDRLELAGAEPLYPLYRAWDDANPQIGKIRGCYPITGMVDEENPEKAGFPAATLRRLDKGVAVHLATAFFDTYWKFGNPDMLAWLREILPVLQPAPLFETDALSFVEVTLRQQGRRAVGPPGQRQSGPRHFVGRHATTSGSTTSRRSARSPAASAAPTGPRTVTIEPGGVPAQTRWRDGVLEVVLPRLEIHACLAIRPNPIA